MQLLQEWKGEANIFKEIKQEQQLLGRGRDDRLTRLAAMNWSREARKWDGGRSHWQDSSHWLG